MNKRVIYSKLKLITQYQTKQILENIETKGQFINTTYKP